MYANYILYNFLPFIFMPKSWIYLRYSVPLAFFALCQDCSVSTISCFFQFLAFLNCTQFEYHIFLFLSAAEGAILDILKVSFQFISFSFKNNCRKFSVRQSISLWPVHSFIHSFIHSGHFYSAPSSPLLLRGAPDYSKDTVSEFHAEAAQETAGKGLAQGPYMTARSGVEPTTLRLKAIDSITAPPCPT